jgi:hypothetical protein
MSFSRTLNDRHANSVEQGQSITVSGLGPAASGGRRTIAVLSDESPSQCPFRDFDPCGSANAT